MSRLSYLATVVVALLAVPTQIQAQAAADGMSAVAAGTLEWVDAEVPGFDAGMRMAIVHGDPSVADQPYTMRLAFPDGYRFPAHWHPRAENLTVLSGTFLLRMGERETGELSEYGPGDFLFIPPKMAHWGGARGETVIQLHGVGPFTIELVRPVSAQTGR